MIDTDLSKKLLDMDGEDARYLLIDLLFVLSQRWVEAYDNLSRFIKETDPNTEFGPYDLDKTELDNDPHANYSYGQLLLIDIIFNTISGHWSLRSSLSDRIGLRPEVLLHAQLMEQTLRKHDDELGNSWKDSDVEFLWGRLNEELAEFRDVLFDRDPETRLPLNLDALRSEAADVSNFLMMIVDNIDLRTGGDHHKVEPEPVPVPS